MGRFRFPIGFRFDPSDEEKIKYLVQKVTGSRSMPLCDDVIGTADLYGEKEPWQIFRDSEDKERYFFTELKKVGKKRICRNVGSGTWSNKGQKVPIYGSNNKLIGHKRCFRYETKKEGDRNNSSSCKWLLKEYTLPDNVLRKEFKDYAFCVLKKKKGSNFPRNVDDRAEECGLDDLMESIMSSNCTSPGLDFAVPALPIVTDNDRAVDIVEECGVDLEVPNLPIVRDDELYEITDSDLSDLWVIETDDAAAVGATPIDVDMSSPPIVDLCLIVENIDKPATEAEPVHKPEASAAAEHLPIVGGDDLYEISDLDLSDLWLIETDDDAAAPAAPIDVDMPSPPISDLCSIIENIDKPAAEPVEECSIIENMDKSGAEPAAEPVEDGFDFDCMFDDVPEDPSCDYNFSLADIPMDRFPALWA
ncbi:hypothetical protein CASFOL_024732 [Castilleja foliolosa]|uniref:NAC domain-containing protein n=1 Tax=Castilleja foliolosa TaxID=1961234 RepID=A0ABD3CP51_9LAMI